MSEVSQRKSGGGEGDECRWMLSGDVGEVGTSCMSVCEGGSKFSRYRWSERGRVEASCLKSGGGDGEASCLKFGGGEGEIW